MDFFSKTSILKKINRNKMKQKPSQSTQIYFIVSCIIMGIGLSYIILPRLIMLLSNRTTRVSVDKLYRDNEYGENYIQYTYKNEFNNQIYSIKRILEYDQYMLLQGKKYVNIQYGQYLPKYTIIEILGDTDCGIGIFLLVTLLLIYKWASS
jgi:hypothetical protein